MLAELIIQDVVLIDRLTVPFAPGLNVLSGETGAGKSILLDSLALALGARSDSALIRSGATQASVTATFSCAPPPALQMLLDEQGLSREDSLILRRTVAKDGKSRAFLNDQPISVNLLRQIGETLLEVHGQFETHGLLNPATHRALLDAFGGHAKLKKETAAAFASWQSAAEKQKHAAQEHDRARAEEEFLRAAAQELDDLAPSEGETDDLTQRRSQLQNREKILEALQTTENALGGERGASSNLAQAGKALARIADKSPDFLEILGIIDRMANEIEDAAAVLARLAQDLDAQTDTLEKIEERLFKLRAVARKHGVPAENLAALREDFQNRIALLTDQGDKLAALGQAVIEAKASYVKAARTLSERRAKAAQALAESVRQELPPLKLERAVFAVDLAPLPETQWGAEGMDRVAFLAATNPGAAPAPLHKVASGGELARFMLALKVVLAKADPVLTLVFDEVDSGIGGATASSVGERLAQLGRDVQVLVVTHSPQVAARGHAHFRVEKTLKAKQAMTRVHPLSDAERIEEIARMLAGTEVTDAARHAAQSLLNDGGEKKPGRQKK